MLVYSVHQYIENTSNINRLCDKSFVSVVATILGVHLGNDDKVYMSRRKVEQSSS
jgi:hypothetical protein